VGGRPFLDHLLQETARYGLKEILLLAGRFGEQVAAAYDGRVLNGCRLRVMIEPEPLGTAGAIRHAQPLLADQFLLLNGDSWIDADLTAFACEWVKARRERPAIDAQMLLRWVGDASRFGRVVMNGNQVAAFTEKDPSSAGQGGLINAGIYILSHSVVAAIPGNRTVSLEVDILPSLVAQGRVRAVRANESHYFVDIGVPESYARAQTELPAARLRPALFLDRDGTLNRDSGYTHDPRDLEWMPGAREAIAYANAANWYVFVVTNQAGVARGRFPEEATVDFHRAMQEALFGVVGHIDGLEYCPHHPEGRIESYRKDCRRRKPSAGMIDDLLAAWPIDRARSVLIGDQLTDLDAASIAGIRSIQYTGGSLLDIVQQAISNSRG
jgi:D-glycero-D-manno-heptose 1,7-bisphosphate phosphatase